MNRRVQALCVLSLVWTTALFAADGDFKASDVSREKTFTVNTADVSPFVVADGSPLAALPPVGWRKGDTVTATAQNGVATTIAADAESSGSAQFNPSMDGVWTLTNSDGDIAKIVIPWSRRGDYSAALANGAANDAYIVDSLQDGPVRRAKDRAFPPTAYTGDNWVRSATAESILTIAPPSGSDSETSLTGTGALPFDYKKAGRWTVTLTMEDGSVLAASVNVVGGFVVSIH